MHQSPHIYIYIYIAPPPNIQAPHPTQIYIYIYIYIYTHTHIHSPYKHICIPIYGLHKTLSDPSIIIWWRLYWLHNCCFVFYGSTSILHLYSLCKILLWLLMLMTSVEGNPKSPFSIATTPKCTPFPGLLHFALDPHLMLSAKQGGIKYYFLSLWNDLTWDWTRSPGPLANTLLIRPMARF